MYFVTISAWKALKKTDSRILGCPNFTENFSKPNIKEDGSDNPRVQGKTTSSKIHAYPVYPVKHFPSPNFTSIFLELGTSTSPSLGWTRAACFIGGFFLGGKNTWKHLVISVVAVFLGYILTRLFRRLMVVAMLLLFHFLLHYPKTKDQASNPQKNAAMDAIELLDFRWKKYLHRISWICPPANKAFLRDYFCNHRRFPGQKNHDELLSAKLQQHLKRFVDIKRDVAFGVSWQWNLMFFCFEWFMVCAWILEYHFLNPPPFESLPLTLNISFDLHTSKEHKWLTPKINDFKHLRSTSWWCFIVSWEKMFFRKTISFHVTFVTLFHSK